MKKRLRRAGTGGIYVYMLLFQVSKRPLDGM
jgi:hypothetical protein